MIQSMEFNIKVIHGTPAEMSRMSESTGRDMCANNVVRNLISLLKSEIPSVEKCAVVFTYEHKPLQGANG